ncbi:MAG: hypothetical protein LC099_08425 [Anaerolineales bacterium]|nr:hypothetical protein [Anaerolineales bacterium]
MNILHVRSVPDDLHARLKKIAQLKNRSLSAQVIIMLTQALEEEERRKKQTKTLNSIRRRRFTPPEGAPSALELLREDRSR